MALCSDPSLSSWLAEALQPSRTKIQLAEVAGANRDTPNDRELGLDTASVSQRGEATDKLTVGSQALRVKFFVRLAHCCQKLNNIEAFFALMTGLDAVGSPLHKDLATLAQEETRGVRAEVGLQLSDSVTQAGWQKYSPNIFANKTATRNSVHSGTA
ncbi:unnamed protein product [Protopolystoma xenopodis]|uniref:Uncharacterized protein n=1 Tax=Protopolystoma xenopodis TaxID=117903 RepID=A0A3S5CVF8_9PLAT|nr:unnamed protein product [Protopolystoma xenopodis]